MRSGGGSDTTKKQHTLRKWMAIAINLCMPTDKLAGKWWKSFDDSTELLHATKYTSHQKQTCFYSSKLELFTRIDNNSNDINTKHHIKPECLLHIVTIKIKAMWRWRHWLTITGGFNFLLFKKQFWYAIYSDAEWLICGLMTEVNSVALFLSFITSCMDFINVNNRSL